MKNKKSTTMRQKALTKDLMSKRESSLPVVPEKLEVGEVLPQTKKLQLDQKTRKVQWVMKHIHKMINMRLTNLIFRTRILTLLTISKTWKTAWKSKTKTSKIPTWKIKREIRSCSKMILTRMRSIQRTLKLRIIEVISSKRCSIRTVQPNSESNLSL